MTVLSCAWGVLHYTLAYSVWRRWQFDLHVQYSAFPQQGTYQYPTLRNSMHSIAHDASWNLPTECILHSLKQSSFQNLDKALPGLQVSTRMCQPWYHDNAGVVRHKRSCSAYSSPASIAKSRAFPCSIQDSRGQKRPNTSEGSRSTTFSMQYQNPFDLSETL